jgi:high-affinity iron transporter
MLSTAIVIFREALEIAMILGIVLAATRGLAGRMRWILGGFAGGAAGAGLVALFADRISQALSGMGQEFFNAMILFTAALVIGWTVVWMRKHAREMTMHLRQVGQEVSEGKMPLYSLALIIGLAMLREGAEIVLFIYGMLLSGQDVASIVQGSVIGVALGVFSGVLLYYGLLKLSARYMLKVTSWMLILLVAGLMAQGAGFLTAAGYFSDFSAPLWDTSWLLSEQSIAGKALHSLIGYSSQPTQVELVFYLATLGALVLITGRMNRRDTAV